MELVISALENIDPEIQSSPRKYTAPARTQSSTLDNRSTGGQARSLPFASSRWLDRLSKRLNNRQETELGRVSRPTVQGTLSYSFSFFMYLTCPIDSK